MEGSPCAVSAMPSRTSQNMMCRTTLSPATSPTPLFTPVPPVRRMLALERLWSDTLHLVQRPKPMATLSLNLDQNVRSFSVLVARRNLYLPFCLVHPKEIQDCLLPPSSGLELTCLAWIQYKFVCDLEYLTDQRRHPEKSCKTVQN